MTQRPCIPGQAVVALLLSIVGFASTRTQAAEPPDPWGVLPTAPLVDLANVVPDAPVLVHSLGMAAEVLAKREPPGSLSQWESRRTEVAAAFRRALGLSTLPPRSPLRPRVTGRHEIGEFILENIVFESRPGFPVTARVYRARSATGRRPAILSPVGHFLSAGKNRSDVQARCLGLASLGFVVLTYDPIGQGERLAYGNVHHDAGYPLLTVDETIAGWMVWDSIRALDYLETRDDVDATRIGMTGNSGGGLNTLFTAAVDERVRAAVVVGFTFEFRNWLKYAGTHCTCTHLPGIFPEAEWFEIAGLIAPRALMMIQGEEDGSFPISGARRAARATEAVFRVLGQSNQVRFVALSRQPHAYTRPFREPMYGWMARKLADPTVEGVVNEAGLPILDESDPRLLSDPDGSILSHAPAVIDLTRERAMALVFAPERAPIGGLEVRRRRLTEWAEALAKPPEDHPHFLASREQKVEPAAGGGTLGRASFISEDGLRLPVLVWSPGLAVKEGQARYLVVANGRGKAEVAQAEWLAPLREDGWTVVAVDLRGRGETLRHYGRAYDTNFRLLANQVLLGKPVAGRRAFDFRRTLDYLERRDGRDGRSLSNVVALGIGEDALPVVLAANLDARIGRVIVAESFHSVISRLRARPTPPPADRGEQWNDPQLDGRVRVDGADLDFGTFIPGMLSEADVPDLLALLAPRSVLFCAAREPDSPELPRLKARFADVTRAAGDNWLKYAPDKTLDAALLRDWLKR